MALNVSVSGMVFPGGGLSLHVLERFLCRFFVSAEHSLFAPQDGGIAHGQLHLGIRNGRWGDGANGLQVRNERMAAKHVHALADQRAHKPAFLLAGANVGFALAVRAADEHVAVA